MQLRARAPSCCSTAPDGIRQAGSCLKHHADFPSFAGAELNPIENVWQYLRWNWFYNTLFENYDAIVS